MKNTILALFLVLGVVVFAQTKKINLSTSNIEWVGEKVTGSHNGTLKFKSGSLTFSGKKLTGGTFEVDMTSLTVTDLQAGKGKEKLEGHLKADDFFGVDKHKTAQMKFTKVVPTSNPNVYEVTADLTIKGITKPLTFTFTAGEEMARTSTKIDRTIYGIKYNSGNFFENLGDKVIYDEFELNVAIFFE
jgi:polyisoprenoid-binding protein YceI